ESMEIADLAEHRAYRRYLEEQPIEGLVTPCRIGRHELSCLLGEIEKNRPRFEKRQRLVPWAGRIDDCRNFAVGAERRKLRRTLVALAEVDEVRLVRQTDLLQHDRDLHAIRRRQGIELEPFRMAGRPTVCNGKGGENDHAWSGLSSELLADERQHSR